MSEEKQIDETQSMDNKKEFSPFVKEIIHFIKYASVSASGTVLQLILFYLLIKFVSHLLPTNEKLADGLTTAFCYLVGHIFQFVINKFFVFKSNKNGFAQTLKYCAVTVPKMIITSVLVPLIFASLEISISTMLSGWTSDENTIVTLTALIKTIINASVQIVLFFVGYILQKIWVFKKDKSEIDEEK